MKPPISLTDPTIKTEKSSQKSHTTDYVDSNEESDRKKALQDGPGSKPRPSFYFFATALIALTTIISIIPYTIMQRNLQYGIDFFCVFTHFCSLETSDYQQE